MCALPNDRIALSDTFGGTIRLLDLRTSEVTTLSGSSEEPGVVDGALEDARFSGPRGIGCLPDGTGLIVADDGALRLIDIEVGQVTTVAGHRGCLETRMGPRSAHGSVTSSTPSQLPRRSHRIAL